MALTDNIVSYWKLDESSGNAADSAGSNTLTNTNTATFSTGKIANGAYLAGASDQYFTITDASQSGLDITGNITLAGWVYHDAIGAANEVYINKTNFGGGSDWAYAFFLTGGKLDLDLSDNGTQTPGNYKRQTQTTASLTDDTWYHVAATYTVGTNTTVLYVNGSSVASTVTYGSGVSAIFNSASPFSMGMGPTDADSSLNGRMDEWGVWSRALSGSEIAELYNGGAGFTYPFVAGPANVKTVQGLAIASVKTINGLAIASVKTVNGLA